MGTTSQKIQYLGETKSKLKDNINLTGAGLTNQTPFRQYATDLKTALLNILNNGIDTLYNNFPKTTGTGTNISLNNTLQAPIRSVINGDTQQEGTPTPDYPQEIKSVTGLQTINITGKNIYNPSFRRSNNTIYSTNCTATEENGLFTLVATDADMRMWNTINEGSNYGDTAGQLYELIYDDYSVSISNDLMVKNFITFYDENKVSLGFIQKRNNIFNFSKNDIANAKYFSIRIGYGQAVVGETYSFKVQLEQGSATEYEPYQTPQEYEINLGKNLVDSELEQGARSNVDGTTLITSNDYVRTKTKIKVQPNTTYYISYLFPTGTSGDIQQYSDNTYLGRIALSNTSFTTPANCNYINVQWYKSGGISITDITNIQLEKGTQATSYSPYFTPIHLYEGDQIIGKPYNWSIKHVMEKYILDNTKNWYIQSTNNYQVSLGGNDRINLKQSAIGLSNYFRVSSSGNDIFMYPILQGSTDYIRIVNAINKWETIEDFKTFISNNNVELVYELAEPTTEPITNTELIEDLNNFYNKAKSYNGQTNISVEGDLQMILDVSAIIDE